MSNPDLHSLPRLERSRYQAFAAVHWTMKVEPAIPGWLTANFHQDFRMLLLHACARERLFCPAYCLMPDHLHLMWLGLSLESDQLNGVKFMRTYLNRLLKGNLLENRGKFAGKTFAVDSRPRPQNQARGLVRENKAGSAVNSRLRPQVGWKLQSQAHDHVLREEERKHNAFARVCFYILANPMRAELVEHETEWPFSGAVVPGYPDLYPFQEDYWELFWKIYYQQREPMPVEPAK